MGASQFIERVDVYSGILVHSKKQFVGVISFVVFTAMFFNKAIQVNSLQLQFNTSYLNQFVITIN